MEECTREVRVRPGGHRGDRVDVTVPSASPRGGSDRPWRRGWGGTAESSISAAGMERSGVGPMACGGEAMGADKEGVGVGEKKERVREGGKEDETCMVVGVVLQSNERGV